MSSTALVETAEVATGCVCGSIGRTDLRQCPVDHHLWRGDQRLTSVGRIVHASFPLDPNIPEPVLTNARDRGSEVDRLFGAYCLGKLAKIPAGTRTDAVALFMKLKRWFDAQNFSDVQVQVLLGADDYGGVLDFRFDQIPCDLKCTYNVEHTARLQVAGYVDLCGFNGGHILHVTERYPTPRLVNVLEPDIADFRILLEHYRMVQRRAPTKENITQ